MARRPSAPEAWTGPAAASHASSAVVGGARAPEVPPSDASSSSTDDGGVEVQGFARASLSALVSAVLSRCAAPVDALEVVLALQEAGVDDRPERRERLAALLDVWADLPAPLFAPEISPREVAGFLGAALAVRPWLQTRWLAATAELMAGPLAGDRWANLFAWAELVAERRAVGCAAWRRHLDVAGMLWSPHLQACLARVPPDEVPASAAAWDILREAAPALDMCAALAALGGAPPSEREHVALAFARLAGARRPRARRDPYPERAVDLLARLAAMPGVVARERWARHLATLGISVGHAGDDVDAILARLGDVPAAELGVVVKQAEALLQANVCEDDDLHVIALLCDLVAAPEARSALVENVLGDLDRHPTRSLALALDRRARALRWTPRALRRLVRWFVPPSLRSAEQRAHAEGSIDVHTAELNARAKRSLSALVGLQAWPARTQAAIDAVDRYLEACLDRAAPGRERERVVRARRALGGGVGQAAGAFSSGHPPILGDLWRFVVDERFSASTAEVLGWAWLAIEAYPRGATAADLPKTGDPTFVAHQKALMREALVGALARCDVSVGVDAPPELVCGDGKIKHMLSALEGFVAGVEVARAPTGLRLARPGEGAEDQIGPAARLLALAEESALQAARRVAREARAAGTFHHPRPADGHDAPTREEIDALRGACQSVVDAWWAEPRAAHRRAFAEDHVRPYLEMLEAERAEAAAD